MRVLGIGVAALLGVALLGYTVGLGIYAVASARAPVPTQPRLPEEADAVLARLGLSDDYPFRHRFLLTPHGRMHFVDEGRGPIVLCLHGNASWSLECAATVQKRSAAERVIAPDLIGFGLSEKPARLPDDPVLAHAQDLEVLLEILGARDVQLVVSGSSAPIGVALARLAPDRVRTSVLEDHSQRASGLAERLARAPVVGELVVQGLGALSPGGPHGALGRLQASWDERASSLALARAAAAREE
jgi:pimeloyl-ACP methyl ester carboxylesterase